MLRKLFLFLFFTGFIFEVYAQAPKCGYDHLRKEFIKRGYTIQHDTISTKTASKTTATEHYIIPVVFHFLLNQSQFNQLGGEVGAKRYIDSQLVVINEDFNALNKDSGNIPQPFKPLFGNMNISFALAHTDPNGSSTPGYEFLITTKSGFELDGVYGSTFGFSDSKYKKSGGMDIWDPSTYLNIWIINPRESGTASTILGLTISPSFAKYYKMPEAELGITLHYQTWGSLANFRGRTLTHELGHFFELRHIWGDDEGKCAFNGGEDDGIDDTPQQAYHTSGCPSYPKFDNCSKTVPGIMFMNFMDYTDDNCQLMFTHGQVNRMRSNLMNFTSAYALTQHPEVLDYPANTAANSYIIYPNPSYGKLNIRFTRTSTDLQYINITSAYGHSIARMEIKEERGLYYFDLSNLSSGLYFVHMKFADKSVVEKILITRN